MKRMSRVRDERGMTYVFVALGFMAFLGASMLAVDVGMLMTARGQSQTSADAGALAGATALAFDSWDDRSATGPAVTNAIAAATGNKVMGANVSVTPADVQFLASPTTGLQSRVQVSVYRTVSRGNPLPTFIATYFRMPTMDVGAVATAEATPANAMTCVKPFTIPDKWIEMQTPPWDPTDTFDRYDKKGNLIANPDVYQPAYVNGKPNPNYSGYNAEANRGMRLVLRAQQGGNLMPSFYFSLAMTNDTGGNDYRWNIDNCNHSIYHWGDPLVQEPGSMQGPTIQGIEALIAQDPNAYWEDAPGCNCVKASNFSGSNQSPRIFPIPLYDPDYYQSGMMTGRTASLVTANWIGFFAEYIDGSSEIHGRIIPISGIYDKYAPNGISAFPVAIRLVQ